MQNELKLLRELPVRTILRVSAGVLLLGALSHLAYFGIQYHSATSLAVREKAIDVSGWRARLLIKGTSKDGYRLIFERDAQKHTIPNDLLDSPTMGIGITSLKATRDGPHHILVSVVLYRGDQEHAPSHQMIEFRISRDGQTLECLADRHFILDPLSDNRRGLLISLVALILGTGLIFVRADGPTQQHE